MKYLVIPYILLSILLISCTSPQSSKKEDSSSRNIGVIIASGTVSVQGTANVGTSESINLTGSLK